MEEDLEPVSRREVGEYRIIVLRSRSEYGEADSALFLLALMLARKLGEPSREAENILIF